MKTSFGKVIAAFLVLWVIGCICALPGYMKEHAEYEAKQEEVTQFMEDTKANMQVQYENQMELVEQYRVIKF